MTRVMNLQITEAFLLFMNKYSFFCLFWTNDYHGLHNYFSFMVKKFHLAVCQLAKSCDFNKNLN